MKFISLEEVLAIHDRMLEIGGGKEGIQNFTLFHSAVERPKAQYGGKFLYNSLWLAGAALLQSLVKNHPFVDGNKRTAFFSTMRLLYKNGFQLKADNSKIIKLMIAVSIGNKTVKQIAKWLKDNSKKVD